MTTLLGAANEDLRAAQGRVDDIFKESTRILSVHGFEMATGTDRKRVAMWNEVAPDRLAGYEARPID
jgi:hypothetical protein